MLSGASNAIEAGGESVEVRFRIHLPAPTTAPAATPPAVAASTVLVLSLAASEAAVDRVRTATSDAHVDMERVVAPPPSVSVTRVNNAINMEVRVEKIVPDPEPAAGSNTVENPSAKRAQCMSIRATAMAPAKRCATNSPPEAARPRRDPAILVAWRRCARWRIAALHTATGPKSGGLGWSESAAARQLRKAGKRGQATVSLPQWVRMAGRTPLGRCPNRIFDLQHLSRGASVRDGR